jgi:hypothetical protein
LSVFKAAVAAVAMTTAMMTNLFVMVAVQMAYLFVMVMS